MTATLFLQDIPAAGFTNKERNFYFTVLLFFFAVYAPGITWLYNVCMWLVFLYSFFMNTLPEKWRLLKSRPAAIIVILFFLLNCCSALLSANITEGISWVGIRLSLLIFAWALGTVDISKALKDRIIAGFIAATCFAATICLLYGLVRAFSRNDMSLLYNDNLSDLVNLQSIYFAMLINIALMGIWYLFLSKQALINKNLLWLMIAILLPVHFLLASRMAIIFLYTLVLIFSLYQVFIKQKVKQGLFIAGGIIVAGFLLFFLFPKTFNRFREINYTSFHYNSTAKESHFNTTLTPDQWNGANIRIAVWECAWAVTKQHILLGTGLGDKMDELKKQYAEKSFVFGIQTNRNVHNTYLDVWMSLGIIGLILFLAGFFVLPIVKSIQTNDWFGILVLVCLLMSLMTETYLDRTAGNTLLAFFVAFIGSYKKTGKIIEAY